MDNLPWITALDYYVWTWETRGNAALYPYFGA